MGKPPKGINKHSVRLAILFGVVMLCALYLIIFGEGRRDLGPIPVQAPSVEEKQPVTISGREVTLYFSSTDGKGLSVEIAQVTDGEDELSELVGILISGSKSGLGPVIPEGTKLLSTKIEEGVAYLDLSREFVDNHWGGSSGELQSVYGIVNTVIANFDDVETVQLLVEGKKVETIRGHILINSPIAFDDTIINH